MKKTLKNGDVITTETIADKIRRIAKHPTVVKNRRLLKAMYHITKREPTTKMTFANWDTNVNGGTRSVIAVVATCDVVNNGRFAQSIGKSVVMFPLNSYDPVTNEPPTISSNSLGIGLVPV